MIWGCGFAFPTVDADDRAALSSYLDAGGRLFITGQDIGWDMNDQGGDALAWYHDYLHANFINDDTNDYTLTGEDFDPIGNGLSITISGGDGANNQDYPSDIDPRDGAASIVFRYNTSSNGAIKADTGIHRVVYFAFGYEAINNATDRAVVMDRVLDWLSAGTNAVGEGLPEPYVLHQNVPNPFNPKTIIRFDLAYESHVQVDVFSIDGRHIRSLADQVMLPGSIEIPWLGTDDLGRFMSSGTYFYRVQAGDYSNTRSMMLVR